MLRHLVNIQHWLNNDPVGDWQARLQRDRAIQLAWTDNTAQDPLAQILRWWEEIDDQDSAEDIGGDLVLLFKWSSIFTAIIGTLFGASSAMAVLRYDGSEPINVLVVFSVLVLAPLVLLTASLCLPLVKSNGLLGNLNSGSIVQSIIRTRFSHVDSLVAFASAGMEKFLRWRLLGYSQVFGLGFALAALAVLLLKVTLTDLAFAWGTTLNIETDAIYSFVQAISMPWAAWLPAAAPDEALVVASKYYRLGGHSHEVSAAALTGWWAFVALGLFFYGVMLRTLVLIFSRVRASHALKQAFLNDPQSIALLERLNSEAITSSDEALMPEDLMPTGKHPTVVSGPAGTPACVFLWHNAPAIGEISSQTIFAINEEADLVVQKDAIKEAVENVNAVQIICKGWEPPLLECHDFLRALRTLLGPAPAIVISPVDENGAASPVDDKNTWRASLAKISDAHLYIS